MGKIWVAMPCMASLTAEANAQVLAYGGAASWLDPQTWINRLERALYHFNESGSGPIIDGQAAGINEFAACTLAVGVMVSLTLSVMFVLYGLRESMRG